MKSSWLRSRLTVRAAFRRQLIAQAVLWLASVLLFAAAATVSAGGLGSALRVLRALSEALFIVALCFMFASFLVEARARVMELDEAPLLEVEDDKRYDY